MNFGVNCGPTGESARRVSNRHNSIDDPLVSFAEFSHLLHQRSTGVTLTGVFAGHTTSAHLTIAKDDVPGAEGVRAAIEVTVGQADLELDAGAGLLLDLSPASGPVKPTDVAASWQTDRLNVTRRLDVTIQTEQSDVIPEALGIHIVLVDDLSLDGNHKNGIGAGLLAVALVNAVGIGTQVVLAEADVTQPPGRRYRADAVSRSEDITFGDQGSSTGNYRTLC